MVLHLVSGFLGSGKSTAISAAIRIWRERGQSAGVVTNDQGKYLVDTQYFQAEGIPSEEVTGGCFCCNYNDLTQAIGRLQKDNGPLIIFAESVGSCTDLVATVIKPLLTYHRAFEALSFSTFVDASLLHSHLLGKSLHLQDDTEYIWHKQLQEADILVINKIDLIPSDEMEMFRLMAENKFKKKMIIYQNSLNKDSVGGWIQALDTCRAPRTTDSLVIDYARYGAGEANLAWLDQSLEILTRNGTAGKTAHDIIESFTDSIRNDGMAIGHLKFMLHSSGHAHKVSVTATTRDVVPSLPILASADRVLLVINARIETSPATLRALLSRVTEEVRLQHGAEILEKNISFFRPGFPKPVHRIV